MNEQKVFMNTTHSISLCGDTGISNKYTLSLSSLSAKIVETMGTTTTTTTTVIYDTVRT